MTIIGHYHIANPVRYYALADIALTTMKLRTRLQQGQAAYHSTAK
jgi:hypothetical protein